MQAKLMQMELIIQTYATLSKHMQCGGGMHLDIPRLVEENVGKMNGHTMAQKSDFCSDEYVESNVRS